MVCIGPVWSSKPKGQLNLTVFKRHPCRAPQAGSAALPISRHGQLDHSIVMRTFRQTISSHGLNHWPVLSEKCRRIVDIGRLHLDAASLSSAVVRYLKMERVAYCLRIFIVRSAFAAHWCPPSCVEL